MKYFIAIVFLVIFASELLAAPAETTTEKSSTSVSTTTEKLNKEPTDKSRMLSGSGAVLSVLGSGSSFSGMSMASGADGKMHYIKNVNGKVTHGIWNGPIPTMAPINVNKIMNDAMSDIFSTNSKTQSLSSSIDDEVNKALSSLNFLN